MSEHELPCGKDECEYCRGYERGFKTGFEHGQQEGYDRGKKAGMVIGHKEGYEVGHEEGWIDRLADEEEEGEEEEIALRGMLGGSTDGEGEDEGGQQ